MCCKVSREVFLQTIVNNTDGLNNQELASKMGISEQHFYNLRNKYTAELQAATKDAFKAIALEQRDNLQRNASKGDTSAAKLILEIADVYQPRAKLDIDVDHKITVVERYIEGAKPVIDGALDAKDSVDVSDG